MEKTTPFSAPLLNNEICRYLSPKDLARCVQVSKAWSDWFSPALWRDLDCHIRLPYVYVHTLTRQQEHIQIVRNITMKRVRLVLGQQPYRSLTTLDFLQEEAFTDIRRAQIQVLRMLENISTLQCLHIKLALDRDNVYQQWIRVLEALPHLGSLSLKSVRFVSSKAFQKILQLCIGYKRLAFTISGEKSQAKEDSEQEYQDTKATIERMPEMHLQELSFNSHMGLYEGNVLQPLLGRCPRMEKLDIAWLYHVPTVQHLSKALKEKKLPLLRHLTMGGIFTQNIQSHLAELLSYIERGMEILEVDALGTSMIQSLTQYHHHSLRRLDFGYTGILLWKFSDLMASLSSLRSVTVKVNVEERNGTNDIPLDTHWECVELRSLRLRLETWNLGIVMGSPEWERSMHKRGLDHVFSEVAELGGLRDLKIGWDQKDLYLMKSGYLTQLEGLKQLEVFDLASAPPEEFGRNEALWMANNLPRLAQVFTHGASEVFKRSLLEKRPQVEIFN